MKKHIITLISVITLLLVGTRPAMAALVEMDLQSSNDKLLTLDTDTGLEWLDVTQTLGLSINDIINGAGSWFNQGFRYASDNELVALWSHVGLTSDLFSLDPSYLPAAYEFQSLLGFVQTDPQTRSSTGMTPTLSGTTKLSRIAYVNIFNNNDVNSCYDCFFQYSYDYRENFYGSWLVKESAPVPIPATAWLLLSGILGIGGFCKSHKSRDVRRKCN